MGFNRRKMEDQHRHAVEKEAAARRATDAQVLEDIGSCGCAARPAERSMQLIFARSIVTAMRR
jgi:hypothetical protein